MRVAALRRYGDPLVIEEWPDPEPTGDEVLVNVQAAGICHTDLHLMQWRNRPLPLVMGHEIAGYAEGFGHVLVHQSWGCGQCELCRRGEEQLCPNIVEAGFERPGGYAEKILVPSSRYLLPLDGLSPQRAAPLTDAGATAYRAARRARNYLPVSGGRAVIIGVGALGQFAVQFLRLLSDAEIVAVDVSDAKLERALTLGADHAVRADELTGTANIVLDFVSEDDTFALAARLMPPGGLIMRVGSGNGSLTFGRGVVPPEVTFTSARGGSLTDVAAVLDFARRGKLQWDVEEIDLDAINDGLERLRRGEVANRLVLTHRAPQ